MLPKHLFPVILYKFLLFSVHCKGFPPIAPLSIGVEASLGHVVLWKLLLKSTLTITIINTIDH